MARAEQLITEHLDLWSSAIKAKPSAGRGSSKKIELYGLAKLRELIFELAINGMLAPQDANDEPASILLQKIQKEKEESPKAGKIKKSNLKGLTNREKNLFKVPLGWEWVPLGMIGNIFNGNSINSRAKEEMYTNVDGRPFIATKDVGYGFEPIEYNNGVAIPANEKNFKTAKKGSVLICSEGGSAGRKCGISDREICFGNKLFANELYGGIEPRFILTVYLSRSFFTEFKKQTTGIIGGISSLKFNHLPCPLPPIAEQKRIADKVDELMRICDQLEEEQENNLETHETLVSTLLNALTSAVADAAQFANAWQLIKDNFDILFTTESSVDQLKQTILQLAVMGKLVEQDPGDEPAVNIIKKIEEEQQLLIKEKKIKRIKPLPILSRDDNPFSIPRGWLWVHAQAICDPSSLITYGILKPEWVKVGIPTVRVKDIQNGSISIVGLGECSEERASKFTKTLLKEGDLLIAKDGATLGKTGFVPPSLAGGNITQHVLRFPITQKTNRFYIRLVIDAPLGQAWMKGETKGVALPGVNVGDFRLMPIPLPPMKEQHRIVAKIDELMALCDQLKASLAKTQATLLNLADSNVEQAIHSPA